jgi:hypothetical protein
MTTKREPTSADFETAFDHAQSSNPEKMKFTAGLNLQTLD